MFSYTGVLNSPAGSTAPMRGNPLVYRKGISMKMCPPYFLFNCNIMILPTITCVEMKRPYYAQGLVWVKRLP